MDKMEPINGKVYPMWSQFIEKKERWIGGHLREFDIIMGMGPETEITDVTLKPNGTDSAMITFHGKDYDCGYDVKYVGISGKQDSPGWLTLSSTWGDFFQISDNATSKENKL